MRNKEKGKKSNTFHSLPPFLRLNFTPLFPTCEYTSYDNSFFRAAEESLLQFLEHLLSLLPWPRSLQGCFSWFSSLLTGRQHFLPFLKHIFCKMPPPWLQDSAMPWEGWAGDSRNWLCPVWGWSSTATPHRGHPTAPTASDRAPIPNSYLYNPGNPHPIYIYI